MMASSELESLYKEIILEAAKERHGYTPGIAGSSTADAAAVAHAQNANHCGTSHQFNPTCGDELTLLVELSDDHTRIATIAWDGQGCSISQASVSLMTDLLTGKTLAEAHEMIDEFRTVMRSRGTLELDVEKFDDATALSGTSRFLARVKCAMLGWVALEEALLKLS